MGGEEGTDGLDEIDPGTPTLNLPFSARLREPLDDAVLARALNEVVRRHEVLRTTFGRKDGQPRLRIAPALHIPLPVIDLRGLDPASRQREAFRLEAEETLLPFDLARGPLVRARCARSTIRPRAGAWCTRRDATSRCA